MFEELGWVVRGFSMSFGGGRCFDFLEAGREESCLDLPAGHGDCFVDDSSSCYAVLCCTALGEIRMMIDKVSYNADLSLCVYHVVI